MKPVSDLSMFLALCGGLSMFIVPSFPLAIVTCILVGLSFWARQL